MHSSDLYKSQTRARMLMAPCIVFVRTISRYQIVRYSKKLCCNTKWNPTLALCRACTLVRSASCISRSSVAAQLAAVPYTACLPISATDCSVCRAVSRIPARFGAGPDPEIAPSPQPPRAPRAAQSTCCHGGGGSRVSGPLAGSDGEGDTRGSDGEGYCATQLPTAPAATDRITNGASFVVRQS